MDAFTAIHFLSRGRIGTALEYQTSFADWMKASKGYSFEQKGSGFSFFQNNGDSCEQLGGDTIQSDPIRGFFKSFLEDWPRNVEIDELYRRFGEVTAPRIADFNYIVWRLSRSGLEPNLFLVPIRECEAALVKGCLFGTISVWGRRHSEKSDTYPIHELIPPEVFIGEPILDWIAGTLGTSARSIQVESHRFPSPPLFDDVQFDGDSILQMRRQLVELKRQAFLDGGPAALREQRQAEWSGGDGGNCASTNLEGAINAPPTLTAAHSDIPVNAAAVETSDQATSGATTLDAAEKYFQEHFASKGTEKSARITKKRAYGIINRLYPTISEHSFLIFIWKTHAPEAWKKQGRPPLRKR